jgi:undecaprenyl-phosphate 4-deoxy-4-formamido-L-arabinose transferase
MVDLTVVIPIYNGAGNLEPLLARLVPVLEHLDLFWEILFIDDCSSDGGFQRIEEYHKRDNRIRAIRLLRNAGQQNAVYCGLCSSGGSLIITMDDDLQHPPEIIPELLSLISRGYDLVYAVNREAGRKQVLRIGTGITDLFFSLFLKKPRAVEIGSYRIMTRELVLRIKKAKTDFVYVSALIFKSTPIPVVHSFRYVSPAIEEVGRTRINLKSRFELFLKLFAYYGPFSKLKKRRGDPFLIERRL